MSFSLTLNFISYEELQEFIGDMEKVKNWKNRRENKSKNQIKETTEPTEEIIEVLKSDVDDKRGLHIKAYHNEAKIYQSLNPMLSYRECLSYVYKNKQKNI